MDAAVANRCSHNGFKKKNTLWLQFDWHRKSSSGCRSLLLRDQTGGLLMAEWTLSNLEQLLHLIIKIWRREGRCAANSLQGWSTRWALFVETEGNIWQRERRGVITSQVLMFGTAISGYWISVDHYGMDCGRNSIIKASLHHVPLSSYSTVIPCGPEWFFFVCLVFVVWCMKIAD